MSNDTVFRSDHLYYDISMTNYDAVGQSNKQLIFNDTRSQPYLDNPRDYYMSVVRFSVETPSLPLFIPKIQPSPNTNVDLTVYSITLSYNYSGTVYDAREFVEWESEEKFVTAPSSVPEFNSLKSNYYFCYSYPHFINLVNKALKKAYNNLSSQIINAGGSMPSPNAPFFNYDQNTSKFSLYADKNGYDNGVTISAVSASTANLAGYVYANGTAGVGATLTAGANGAFVLDGINGSLGDLFLIKNQTAGEENGLYLLTTVGDAGTPAVLTRAPFYDTATEMNSYQIIYVVSGTVNEGKKYKQTATITTVGTDALTFTEYNNISLFMNIQCYLLFTSFDREHFSFSSVDGKIYKLKIYDKQGLNNVTLSGYGTNYTALKMEQDYNSSVYWCPVSTFIFTCSQLPVVPTMTTVPTITGTSGSGLNSSGNNASVSARMTDLIVPLENGTQYCPAVTYYPTAEYRLFDLFGDSPLNTLNITVLWQDEYGNEYPFFLTSGCSANIKILFRKKYFSG